MLIISLKSVDCGSGKENWKGHTPERKNVAEINRLLQFLNKSPRAIVNFVNGHKDENLSFEARKGCY